MTNRPASALTGSTAALGPDPRSFRSGMSKLVAAVNVITTVKDGEPYGFTASAVCSVTDSPPTLLVCVNRSNRSHPVIASTRVLCVNTLSAPHEPLSMAFAGSSSAMAARFAQGEWTGLATGAPVLVDAAVAFDCRVAHMYEIGTHDVLFCEVVAMREGVGSEGLVYFDRRFHRLA